MRAVKRGGAEEVIRIHGLDVYLSGVGAPSMAWPEAPALEPAPQPDQPKEKVKKNAEEEGKSTEEKPQASPLPLKGQPEELEPPQPNLPSKPRSPLDLEHRTVALSGGQMQRVAISRAFMRADEAMLVVLEYAIPFDDWYELSRPYSEPSASLDARAEYELFQRIYALSRGDSGDTRTTVYISHRFSTVRRADQIAVVEHGEIIELGSHKQLMDLNGRYAEFFNLQVQAFSE
ncbi:related to ABC transporter ATP-binding protein-Robiginitalea biformata [Serendipita indica DSM 11827]|uniref:Related to ABC transporter ATP-binding protein-Robiginitalea biformata n=1 Tax=Serendipita indica (strain DSM 11827) TaxID=1109443 RepID=G4TQI3_SERID|nr:related to ABC transporter ATP-binding protein-Robiginitalea biformata [Serendipita indica DSM 11827]